MAIDNLMRWRWVLIGLTAGTLLAYARPPADPTVGVRSAGAEQFEQDLGREPLRTGEAFVANIVVYPPAHGAYVVRFDLLTPSKDTRGWRYVPWCMDAGAAYASPSDPSAAPETIVGYLERTAKKYPHVRYRYAWWAEARWWFALWAGGGAAAVGVLWPLALRRLVASAPARAEPASLLPRTPGAVEAGGNTEPSGLNATDGARLAKVNELPEESLGSSRIEGTKHAPESPENRPVVVTLTGGPAADVSLHCGNEELREYEGEFYPVARNAKLSSERRTRSD